MRKNFWKFTALLTALIFVLCMTVCIPTSFADDFTDNGAVRVLLNGVPILNCRTFTNTNGALYVPVRKLTECLDMEVLWDAKDNSVILRGNTSSMLKFWSGNANVELDDRVIFRFDSAPALRGDTMYVPLEIFRVLTGYDIQYNHDLKIIEILTMITDGNGEKLYETVRMRMTSIGMERICKNALYKDRAGNVLISGDDFKDISGRVFLNATGSTKHVSITGKPYYVLDDLIKEYGLVMARDEKESEITLSLANETKLKVLFSRGRHSIVFEEEKVPLSSASSFDQDGKYIGSLTEAIMPVSEYRKVDPQLKNIVMITKNGTVEKDSGRLERGDYYIVNDYVMKVPIDAVPVDEDGTNCRQGWESPSETELLFYEMNRVRDVFGTGTLKRNDGLLDMSVRKDAGDVFNSMRDTVRKNVNGVYRDIRSGNMPNTYHILGKMVDFNEYYVYAEYTYQMPSDWINVLLSSDGHRTYFTDHTATEGTCLLLRSPEGWGLSVYSSNAPGIWIKMR